MKLHAFYALLLLALIAVPGSVAAQDSTLGEIDDPPAASAAPEAEDGPTGEEPPRVEYENPIPEFLRGHDLPYVVAGRKIVTVPVSAMDWVRLDRRDLVRVDLVRKDVKEEAADGTTLTAEELTVKLADEAEIYAISSFAPANTLAPVCLEMSPDEARACLEALSGDGQILLTVVRKYDTRVPTRDETTPDRNEEWPVKLPALSLEVDRNITVTHDSRIKTVDGFDSSVIEVDSIDPDRIRVTALHAGSTTITLIDEQSVQNLVDVVVTDENGEFKKIIGRLYPEARIQVMRIKDAILLRGTVADGMQVEEIVEIAEQFAPRVLNQLRTADGHAAEMEASDMSIPAGMQVVTIEVASAPQIHRHLMSGGGKVDVIANWPADDGPNNAFVLLTKATIYSVEHAAPLRLTLLVPPDAADALRLAQVFASFSVVLRAPDDDSGPAACRLATETHQRLLELKSSTGTDQPMALPLGNGADNSLEDLRGDLRALHDDVRQLIEILKQRADEPVEGPADGAEALQTGVLFFQADWCGPCQKMWPIVARRIEEGLPFKSVDIDRDQELRTGYKITSTPTFVFLKDGEEVHRHVGILTDEQLVELCRSHLSERRDSGSVFDSIEKALGLQFVPLGENPSELKGGNYRGGLKISSVAPGSPTEQAGLQRGDVLVGLDRWETIEPDDVTFVISRLDLKNHATLKFYVVRDGETLFGHLELEATAQEQVPPAVCPTEPVLETQPQ